jgi:hypothetical protein
MPHEFSLTPSRCAVIEDPSLRQEIRDHTGSDEATSSILSAIDRFGGDSSIVRFEIAPKPRSLRSPHKSLVAWRVRAVRS